MEHLGEFNGRPVIKSLSESGWDKLGITAQDILKVVGDLPKDTQIREIENSMLPQFLKDALLENNNTAIYEELDVTTFPEYVAAYISRMLLNVVSFLVTFLIAIILVSALMYAVNIIGEFPLLGAINHLAGGVLGIGLGIYYRMDRIPCADSDLYDRDWNNVLCDG